LLAQGKTDQAAAFVAGFRPHFVITDLPYGIQHNGPLIELLTSGLPVWAGLLPAGGTLVFAWDATRFERSEMVQLVEAAAPLQVLETPPYQELAHRVDRVIKRRDIVVARRL
jgi:tRNA G10  N-methylase Trm11